MKPLENRQKVEEDRKRREAEREHPSTRGRLAPVVPIRPNVEEKPDGEAS